VPDPTTSTDMLEWLPSLELRIAFIIVASILIYVLTTRIIRRTNRLIIKRYRATSPDLESRTRTLHKLTRIAILAALVLLDVRLILPQLGKAPGLVEEWSAKLSGVSVIGAVAVLLYWVLVMLLGSLEYAVADDDTASTTDLERRTQTISGVLRSSGLVVIIVLSAMMALQVLGLDIAPILAGAGIVGIAVGFGAQALVQDTIAGFFILLEDQFRVGEFVKTGDFGGTVERMSLRSTWLRAIDGALHVVPNGEIRIVSNRSRNWARVFIDVHVPYEEDIDRAEALLNGLTEEITSEEGYAHLVRGQASVLSIAELAESWVTLKILLMTSAGQQWAISRDLRKRIVRAFNREGIRFAYPQTVVHAVKDRPDDEDLATSSLT